jgi:hypothetical protein
VVKQDRNRGSLMIDLLPEELKLNHSLLVSGSPKLFFPHRSNELLWLLDCSVLHGSPESHCISSKLLLPHFLYLKQTNSYLFKWLYCSFLFLTTKDIINRSVIVSLVFTYLLMIIYSNINYCIL